MFWQLGWLAVLLQPFVPTWTVEPAPEWERLFRPTQGWLGSDCAYSVPLGGERLLWLFDDTFVGRLQDGKRRDATMVRNSVAVQVGKTPATAQVRFVVRQAPSGQPADFLAPPDGIGWCWFGHGAVVDNRLWLFVWQFEPAKTPPPFNFRLRACWLAEVPNYADEPEKWRFTFHPVPFFVNDAERTVCFGNAVLQHGDWVFIYGVTEDKRTVPLRRGVVIARAPARELERFEGWRFWSNGEWTTDWRTASVSGNDIGFEFTVSFVPSVKRFALVYSPADLTPVVRLRWAPTPVGEWSTPVDIYRCPPVQWHSSVFCYAAKAHPALSGDNELLITYASNASDFRQLLEDGRLYFPHFIRIRFNGQ